MLLRLTHPLLKNRHKELYVWSFNIFVCFLFSVWQRHRQLISVWTAGRRYQRLWAGTVLTKHIISSSPVKADWLYSWTCVWVSDTVMRFHQHAVEAGAATCQIKVSEFLFAAGFWNKTCCQSAEGLLWVTRIIYWLHNPFFLEANFRFSLLVLPSSPASETWNSRLVLPWSKNLLTKAT